jgi:hypothetical protein
MILTNEIVESAKSTATGNKYIGYVRPVGARTWKRVAEDDDLDRCLGRAMALARQAGGVRPDVCVLRLGLDPNHPAATPQPAAAEAVAAGRTTA